MQDASGSREPRSRRLLRALVSLRDPGSDFVGDRATPRTEGEGRNLTAYRRLREHTPHPRRQKGGAALQAQGPLLYYNSLSQVQTGERLYWNQAGFH